MTKYELAVFDRRIDWMDVSDAEQDFDTLCKFGFNEDLAAHLAWSNRLIKAYTLLQEMTVGYKEQALVHDKLWERVNLLMRGTLMTCYDDTKDKDFDVVFARLEELYSVANNIELERPRGASKLSFYSDEQNSVLFSVMDGYDQIMDALKTQRGYFVTNEMKDFDLRSYIAYSLDLSSEV